MYAAKSLLFLKMSEKVPILLHTFENYYFRILEFDIPIEDSKLDGRFVERIRGSSRESSIGVVQNAGTRLGQPPQGLKNRQDPYSGHAVWGITAARYQE